MPYKTIQEAKDAGFPTSAEEIPLTLGQINKLAEIYDAIKERGDVKIAFAVAWTTWKKIYRKEGDKWIEITKASEKPLIIEGDIPVGVINKNGWGIPDSDVKNVINSLKNAVVRICDRGGDEHSCDDKNDPYSEIGRILDAKREGDSIKTKVAITDRHAKQKIEDGTWESTWSPYGHTKTLENGWTHGLDIESLTLVRNPAWDNAAFNISASDKGITLELPLISLFANDTSKGDNSKKEKGNMDEKDKKTFTQGDMDTAVKAAVDKATKETQDKAKVDTEKKIKAALEEKEMITKTDADKMVKAALEKAKGGDKGFTKTETEQRIKAAVEEATKQTRESMEKERLIAAITDTQIKTGVLVDDDKGAFVTKLEAMDMQALITFLENSVKYAEKLNVKAAELKDIQFPIIDTKGESESSISYEEVQK